MQQCKINTIKTVVRITLNELQMNYKLLVYFVDVTLFEKGFPCLYNNESKTVFDNMNYVPCNYNDIHFRSLVS